MSRFAPTLTLVAVSLFAVAAVAGCASVPPLVRPLPATDVVWGQVPLECS